MDQQIDNPIDYRAAMVARDKMHQRAAAAMDIELRIMKAVLRKASEEKLSLYQLSRRTGVPAKVLEAYHLMEDPMVIPYGSVDEYDSAWMEAWGHDPLNEMALAGYEVPDRKTQELLSPEQRMLLKTVVVGMLLVMFAL